MKKIYFNLIKIYNEEYLKDDNILFKNLLKIKKECEHGNLE